MGKIPKKKMGCATHLSSCLVKITSPSFPAYTSLSVLLSSQTWQWEMILGLQRVLQMRSRSPSACCLLKDVGLLLGPHASLLPNFLALIYPLMPEVPVPGPSKACWAVSRTPLSLLVLGRADKEPLAVPPRCWSGAPSPRRPGASAGCWRVRAGSGSPCPGRQGCSLPGGRSWRQTSLLGKGSHGSASLLPHRSGPRGSEATFSAFLIS